MYSFQDTICNLIPLYPPLPLSNLLDCIILVQLTVSVAYPDLIVKAIKMVLLKVKCSFSYWPAIRYAVPSVHRIVSK